MGEIMLCHTARLATPSVEKRFGSRRALILDHLVIEALEPLKILQVGIPEQVLHDGYGTVGVRKTRSLKEAVSAIHREGFDAVVLGSSLEDAWPTAAYEQLAEVAESTPVVVQTASVGPIAGIKQRQHREHDVIVAGAKPALLARLILAAVLRGRALTEEPETEIG